MTRRECEYRRETAHMIRVACAAAQYRHNAERAAGRASRRRWLSSALVCLSCAPLAAGLLLAVGPLAAGVAAGFQARLLWLLVAHARAHRARHGRWPWRPAL